MELRLDATPEELRVFAAETEELLQSLDEQVVRLERDGPSPALLQEVFRAAHTIKGGAAAIGHTRMATLTHALETLLDRLRQGQLAVSSALIDRLFAALDVLRVLAGELERLEQDSLDVDSLVLELEALAAAVAGPTSRNGRIDTRATHAPDGHPPTEATHQLLLEFEPGPWAAVRALQCLLAMDELGEVLVSRPSREQIEQQEVTQRLSAAVRTDRSIEELRLALETIPETAILSIEAHERPDPESLQVEAERSGAIRAEGGSAQAGPARAPAGVPGSSSTVRIDVERLDQLLNLVGELVADRTRLLGLDRALRAQFSEHPLLGELSEATLHLGRVTDELQAEVMKIRMLPIGPVFNRFPRVVRDLSSRQGKRVDLVVEGQETELDRSVIEVIGDPLVHLLRNAVDHGIELPEERKSLGKPEVATLRLAAEAVDNSIVVVVEDDGRGIDPDHIRTRAIERGLVTQEACARLSDSEAVDLIFAPGFSTSEEISDVSGRGVGLDIVRTNVERLGGAVEVRTVVGKGARFVLRLPLTLAIVRALLVRVGQGVYGLPLSAVTETLRVPSADIHHWQRQEAMLLRGQVLPVIRLSQLFGWGGDTGGKDLLVVAARIGERQIGLAIDALLGEQEIVIKSLGRLIGNVRGISSAAVLSDGTVALIVDVPGLLELPAADEQEWRPTESSLGRVHGADRGPGARPRANRGGGACNWPRPASRR